jgi:arsenate reductase
MSDGGITIHHDPDRGTSRNTLAMIHNSGAEPVVVESLKTPPSRVKLTELIDAVGVPVRDILPSKGTP